MSQLRDKILALMKEHLTAEERTFAGLPATPEIMGMEECADVLIDLFRMKEPEGLEKQLAEKTAKARMLSKKTSDFYYSIMLETIDDDGSCYVIEEHLEENDYFANSNRTHILTFFNGERTGGMKQGEIYVHTDQVKQLKTMTFKKGQ